eukprot:CAMPEP_0117697974 /NCGR_PEP_ID=MMETSP0804-20121206/29522_1 /TAXON_ID=1074897 /ORGANISM="Tetraselmis astigmatica, Strain CCMP880" /LENGTH=1387 /DNA_ID=CAMNT_0005512275 /DNA_START=209 /DNA_END=4372 /DNA_ORIENTATION=+
MNRGQQRRRDPQAQAVSAADPGSASLGPLTEVHDSGQGHDSTPLTSIKDYDIRDVISNVVIDAKLKGDDYREIVPNYVRTIFPEESQPESRYCSLQPSGVGPIDPELYKKAIRATLACWDSQVQESLPLRLALCDWLGRALRVPEDAHQAALVEAELRNRSLAVDVRELINVLNQSDDLLATHFMNAAAAKSFCAEEVSALTRLMKGIQRSPPYNGFLEVAVLDAKNLIASERRHSSRRREPFVQVAVVDKEFLTLNKNHGKKNQTRSVPLNRANNSAVWMEKTQPARVGSPSAVLAIQVCTADFKARSQRHENADLSEKQRPDLESAEKPSKMRTTHMLGEIELSLAELGDAITPTELTLQLERIKEERKKVPFLGCLGAPSTEEDSSKTELGPLNSQIPVRVPTRNRGAGQLRIVVRLFQEVHGQEGSGSVANMAGDGRGVANAREIRGASDAKANTLDTDLDSSTGLSLPAPENWGAQMIRDEEDFNKLLAVLWVAWKASVSNHGINDSEVLDDIHNAMTRKRHTFYIDRLDSGNQPGAAVTYPTGDAIFPDVPSVVEHLVQDSELPGFALDKSWWAVVQLFCTMYRVRKPYRDLGVLHYLTSEWKNSYGHLRAVRGVFHNLMSHARQRSLTWREMVWLRELNDRINIHLAQHFEHGSSGLLEMHFDEAVATFQEMQRLLLLSVDGDQATWSPEVDAVLMNLIARGAEARLRVGLPDDPKAPSYIPALIRNFEMCTREMRVDKALAFASFGSVNMAAHGAFNRYSIVREQLSKLQHAYAPHTGEEVLEYSACVQKLEDTVHQHHYALRDERLVDEFRCLSDPTHQHSSLPLVNVDHLFKRPMLSWMMSLRQTVLSWAGGTHQSKGTYTDIVDGLSTNLLELLQSLQEVLSKASKRTMRVSDLAYRFKLGHCMSDLFEAAIQKYSETGASEFMSHLQSSTLRMIPWVASCGFTESTKDSDEVSLDLFGCSMQDEQPVLFSAHVLAEVNCLWFLLSNHHVVESRIQTAIVKGIPFEAVHLDVHNFDLEGAMYAIQGMKQNRIGTSKADFDGQEAETQREDLSELSESLSGYEEGEEDTVQESVDAMMDKLHATQHSLSNLLIVVVMGIAKSLAAVVSSYIQGLVLQVQRSGSHEPREDHQSLETVLSQELEVLTETLNPAAFSLVLEASWYVVVRVLERGVLHTTSPWTVQSDRERTIVSQVLESVAHIWHGNGLGLPRDRIDESVERLNRLLELSGNPDDLLQLVQSAMNSRQLERPAFVDHAEEAPSTLGQMAHANIGTTLAFLHSSVTKPVSWPWRGMRILAVIIIIIIPPTCSISNELTPTGAPRLRGPCGGSSKYVGPDGPCQHRDHFGVLAQLCYKACGASGYDNDLETAAGDPRSPSGC